MLQYLKAFQPTIRSSIRLKHVRIFKFKFQSLFISKYWIPLQTGRVLAIRREDQSVWERRAPFNPAVVRQLVKNGVKVLVQPSNRRAYPMQVKIHKAQEMIVKNSCCGVKIFI